MSTPTSTRRPFDRKRALIGSLTIVALLVLGALWQREHPFSIETSTDIDADPSEVWAALSDFGAYQAWNSALPSVSGELAVGSTIALGDDSARVTKLVDGERMSWETTTGVIGIFDGERSFLLEPIAGGGTRFTQSIEFRGITVPFVSGTLRDDYAPGLHEMNAELRERVEGE